LESEMARPKSEDKRNAILAAAIAVFAEKGIWSTPTSAISRAANVAEGTLFTYFSTKDLLLNELYRLLKLELADVLMAGFPQTASLRTKLFHIWAHYVNWGIANPLKFKVLTQLQVSDKITPETRAVGYAPFAEIERLAVDSIRRKQVYDYPVSFISAIFENMAETTMAAMAQSRGAGIDYCASGFEVFWRGITRT
jgi:AcrR family transcriptional regulator